MLKSVKLHFSVNTKILDVLKSNTSFHGLQNSGFYLEYVVDMLLTVILLT